MIKQNLKQNASSKVIGQLLWAVPISLLVFIILAVMAFFVFEISYSDKIYPGVYVDRVDLSGLTVEEAQQKLVEALPYAREGLLQFMYGEQVWSVHPVDLGYVIDPVSSAQAAYRVGRSDWLLTNLSTQAQAWFNGISISPVSIYEEQMAQLFLDEIASEINQPLIEATLGLEGAEVVVKSGQVGRELRIQDTLALLTVPLVNAQSGVVPLVVEETVPAILDASSQAELARQILSQSLLLTLPGESPGAGPWEIAPEDLAGMLTITRAADDAGTIPVYQIGLNQQLFGIYLNSLAPALYIEPVNARFIFNDDTAQLEVIQSAVIGRELDVQASLDEINTQLISGEHTIALQLRDVLPAVTDDMTGEELGITEKVSERTTYFYGSDAARIQNIETAAAQFHGLLIPPGETFSMAQALGNVSLENGYAEALIIYGDQTIQGVGGGVCQVSTTLFRTVFFGGFPIEERHAHAYRVGYYEMGPNGGRDPMWAGMDATVYVPIVDLKFTNDTDYWLLMETYVYGGSSLTWKFYSTSDGRTVDWTTTGPTNIVPAPDPLYRENPDLPEGVIKQVDYAADGAEISITRTVYKAGVVYFADSFYTKFQAWQAVFEYGPGTQIPDPH